jgi:hypothetical protein
MATADGCGTAEIVRRSGKSSLWCGDGRRGSWPRASKGRGATDAQARQKAASGRHGTERRPGTAAGEAPHLTGRMLAKVAGVSLRSVQRILEAHQIAPGRNRTSNPTIMDGG